MWTPGGVLHHISPALDQASVTLRCTVGQHQLSCQGKVMENSRTSQMLINI